MEIKIIGSNCKNGMQLYKMAERLKESSRDEITVEKLDEEKDVKKYGVTNIPGLVVDGVLLSQGKVLTDKEISRMIKVHA